MRGEVRLVLGLRYGLWLVQAYMGCMIKSPNTVANAPARQSSSPVSDFDLEGAEAEAEAVTAKVSVRFLLIECAADAVDIDSTLAAATPTSPYNKPNKSTTRIKL